jgi:hypothetical protein
VPLHGHAVSGMDMWQATLRRMFAPLAGGLICGALLGNWQAAVDTPGGASAPHTAAARRGHLAGANLVHRSMRGKDLSGSSGKY